MSQALLRMRLSFPAREADSFDCVSAGGRWPRDIRPSEFTLQTGAYNMCGSHSMPYCHRVEGLLEQGIILRIEATLS